MMSRKSTDLKAALSVLPLGLLLLMGSTTALGTAAVLLLSQTAVAQSADKFLKQEREPKGKKGGEKGMIRLANKGLTIRESDAGYFYPA